MGVAIKGDAPSGAGCPFVFAGRSPFRSTDETVARPAETSFPVINAY